MREQFPIHTLPLVTVGGSIKSIFRMVSVFLEHIPPTRPVLLLKDGHASHTSIEVIELARANNVHIFVPIGTNYSRAITARFWSF